MSKKDWKAAFIAAATSFLGKEMVQGLESRGLVDKLAELGLLPKRIPGGVHGVNAVFAALKELVVQQMPDRNVRAFLDSIAEEMERRYRPITAVYDRVERRTLRGGSAPQQAPAAGGVGDEGMSAADMRAFDALTSMPLSHWDLARKYVHAAPDKRGFQQRINEVTTSLMADYHSGAAMGTSLASLVNPGFSEPVSWEEGFACFHIDELVEMAIQARLDSVEWMLQYCTRTYLLSLFHFLEAAETDSAVKAELHAAIGQIKREPLPQMNRKKIVIKAWHRSEVKTILLRELQDYMSGDFINVSIEEGQTIVVDALLKTIPSEQELQQEIGITFLQIHDRFMKEFGMETDPRSYEDRLQEAREQFSELAPEVAAAFQTIIEFVATDAGGNHPAS
ncbi:MAG: hypothetical protein WC505_01450 [Patescibacteria group bacterium]